ncbi:MAG: gluconokinase [bacterium]|nr:gluconokinase [bacterium]
MSQGSDGVVAGVDLGTSATKVVAFTLDGRPAADATEQYGIVAPQPSYVEQDADEIYRAAMRGLRRVVDAVRLRGHEVLAIGLSSAMHGVLPVDGQGEPIGPLLTWMDRRSAALADGWRADGTGLALYRRTGAPMHPMLPLCKLRWLSEHEPERFKRAKRFVSMKELLVFRWFGEWLIDHGCASGTGYFDVRSRAWDPQALELARVEPGRLSQPASALERRTGIRAAIAGTLSLDASTPLVLCSSDGALANLGVGAVERTTMAVTLGTSAAARVVTREPLFDAQGRTFCYALDDEHCVVGGPTSSAGGVLMHLLGLLLPDVPAVSRWGARALLGRRSARWIPWARPRARPPPSLARRNRVHRLRALRRGARARGTSRRQREPAALRRVDACPARPPDDRRRLGPRGMAAGSSGGIGLRRRHDGGGLHRRDARHRGRARAGSVP